jgi:hypothetical protein
MLLEADYPEAQGKMKQFASWFTHGVPGGASLRKSIYQSKTGEAVLDVVEQFFEARTGAELEPARIEAGELLESFSGDMLSECSA